MEDLKEAMSSGEVGKVEWLLQQPDVVSQLRGNEEMQRALLFDGIKKGHTDAALKLLSGIEVNLLLTDLSGKTALHEATLQGNTYVVIRLLALKSELLNVRDNKLHAPLHYAAFLGHADIANHLIQHGADVNLQARGNWTALHYAARGGHTRIVMSLLNAGAQTTLKLASSEPANEREKTPADLALQSGFPHVAKMIAEFGKEKLDPEAMKKLTQAMNLRSSNMGTSSASFGKSVGSKQAEHGSGALSSSTNSKDNVTVLSEEQAELFSGMRKRLLRLENQQGRIDELNVSLNSLTNDFSSVKTENKSKFNDIIGVLSKIAPEEYLNPQKDDWRSLMAEMDKMNERNNELQNRLYTLENRLRYLEYILLAFLVIYVLF